MIGSNRRAWIAAALLAAIVASASLLSVRPGVLGLFHDDGLYAATAKSLASGTGYRLVDLPGSPAETKYPIVYPFILSLLWRVSPTFPGNIMLLKGLNAVTSFAIMLVACALFRRETGRLGIGALLYVVLVGTSSTLIRFTDFTVSDLLFELLVMSALLLHDQPTHDRSSWNVWGGAVVVSLGLLTRELGASLVVAGLAWAVLTRTRREAAIYAVIVVVLVSPWLAWSFRAAASPNPLLDYYTSYEKPAIVWLRSNPRLTWQVVSGNLTFLALSFDDSFLLYMFPLLRWIFYPIVALGAVLLVARHRPVFLVVFVVVYVAVVLDHPFLPFRYVMPLVPVVLVCLFAGLFYLESRLVGALGAHADRTPVAAGVLVPVALLLVLNLTSLRMRIADARSSSSASEWAGFTETFDWVRRHTQPDDVLATPYDPVYYLYTDRRAVRPWFHQPETYFYPAWHATPRLGAPDKVREALQDLGVRYLIVDPLDGFVEGGPAPQLFEQILAGYPAKPARVFVSSDGRHQVYDLRSSR